MVAEKRSRQRKHAHTYEVRLTKYKESMKLFLKWQLSFFLIRIYLLRSTVKCEVYEDSLSLWYCLYDSVTWSSTTAVSLQCVVTEWSASVEDVWGDSTSATCSDWHGTLVGDQREDGRGRRRRAHKEKEEEKADREESKWRRRRREDVEDFGYKDLLVLNDQT